MGRSTDDFCMAGNVDGEKKALCSDKFRLLDLDPMCSHKSRLLDPRFVQIQIARSHVLTNPDFSVVMNLDCSASPQIMCKCTICGKHDIWSTIFPQTQSQEYQGQGNSNKILWSSNIIGILSEQQRILYEAEVVEKFLPP